MFCKRVRLLPAAGPGGVSGSCSVLGAAASKRWARLLPAWGRQERLPLPVSLSVCPSVHPWVRPCPFWWGAGPPRALAPGACRSVHCAFKCTFLKGTWIAFFPGSGTGRREAKPGSALSGALCVGGFFLPVYRDPIICIKLFWCPPGLARSSLQRTLGARGCKEDAGGPGPGPPARCSAL